MRTRDEILAEAEALRAKVNGLYAHFQDVQTWESGFKKVSELFSLTKEMMAANRKVDELALELMQLGAQELGEEESRNDIDFIS